METLETADARLDRPEAAGKRVIQGFRLSSQQEHLWRLLRGEPGTPYQTRCAVRIAGSVDEGALWGALEEVVERHEILRTSFELLPGLEAPLQVIGEPRLAARETRELPDLPVGERGAAVADLLERLPARPVEEGGLAVTLVRLAADDLALLLDLSPLAADAPTLALLASEVARACAALYARAEPEDAGTQYADFAEWQRELLQGDDLREEAATWQGPGALAAAGPPLPWTRSDSGPYRPVETAVSVGEGAPTAAARAGEAFWLTCWAVLLGRLSGERRVALAAAVDGRSYEELAGSLGPFARFLPVVCDVPPETRFERVLTALRAGLEDAAARQDGFAWEEASFPAFAFSMEEAMEPLAAGGATFSLAARIARTERSVAELLLRRREGRVEPVLRYDSTCLAAAEAERLSACLGALAESAAAHPEAELGDLDVLPAAERERLLVELNRTSAELPGAGLLHAPFLRQAARTPGRPAVRSEGAVLTYGELALRAGRLARRLRGLGVDPEVPVAVCIERSPDMVIGLLGVLAAGGAYVPLDPEHPQERREGILAEVRPLLALTQARLAGLLPAGLPRLCLDEPLGDGPDAEPSAELSPDHLAYILYTSGSTGRPKGVMVPHRAISNRLFWMQRDYPLGEEDRVLQKTPYGFDASIWEIFCPLYAGAELVLARPGGHQDMGYLAAVAAAEGITTLQLVPSLLRAFLDEPAAAACTGLRRMFCGGELLATDLAARFSSLLGADLQNLYGPTEAAIDATSWPCRAGIGESSVPIGRPITNLRVYLTDARMRLVPAGVPGELCIGGVGLARGYLGRPDATAERFVPDPFGGLPGGRLYRTGDLARHRPGGELEYLGRIDRQLKIRGVRIEPQEIEMRLRESPAVREAVVAVRDEAGGPRLIAWIVPREAGTPVDPWALRDFLRARLPEPMLPAAFVPIPAVPLTPNGKLDLTALPEPATALSRSGGAVAPRNQTEELLAALWAEVLGAEAVGVNDNFFDLGGHSLSATQVVSRLRKSLQVELAVHQLFDAPTVAGLARELEAAMRGGAAGGLPPVEPSPRQEEMPLSFAQQRLWFFERMRPGTPVFNIVVAFRLRGSLDAGALARALTEIVRRHEILRTTFPDRRGLPIQVIGPPWPFPLPCVDLSGLPVEAREAEMLRRAAAEGDRPFDLARGPLLRALLLRLGPQEHALPFVVHHIVSDAWSSGVLTREIGSLYRTFTSGGPSPLSELPVQYADYAVWQQNHLAGEALEAQTAYWKRRLDGAPPLLELPTDHPRPERPTYRGITRPVSFPAELAEALAALGRRHGATLFMTLLAAFYALLHHLSGREDLVVGTDVANRNREETEGVIGFFINQLVLRTHLGGDPLFSELLARVRTTTLEAYAHQDAPFEHLVDALRVPRTLAHPPLFQVKLFLENTPPADLAFAGLELEPVELATDVAKLDLTLAFWHRPGSSLSGWINYSTDLFDTPRIERLLGQYRALLEAVVERPGARLSELGGVVGDIERKERDMEKKGLKDLSFKKFKAVAPKAVELSEEEVVERSFLSPGQELPLVLRPLVPDVDPAEWVEAHRESLEADLLRHGAILFRGFGIDTPETLERFAGVLCPDLFNENGEHPRESVTGNVYTPVFYPQDQQLLWHNENSFNWSWPRKIFFCCANPPDRGGETPIVDSRRVYAELPAEIRERFESRGVLYQRNYSEAMGLPWQTVFRSQDREEVEGKARESHLELEWRDGDRLRTRAVRPAVVAHPVTGDLSWFNQAQHWHVACLDAETSKAMRSLFPDEDLPRHCYHGDGTPIEDRDMEAILDVYRRLEVTFPWEKGDVLLVDNVLAAHGRNPFAGPRKILVAMGQMTTYDQVLGGTGK
jgi:amino acid adenylation domain-containing protein